MARIPSNKFTWPWGDSDPCPCGSTEIYASCCKQGHKKFPRVQVPDLSPPGPVTNYAHPSCYMASTGNCCETISREHYISAAILREFPQLAVSGFRWQTPGEVLSPGIGSMVAKILCARHNSALAPLDELAVRAFRALTAAPHYVASNTAPGRAQHYLISGEALELWMIKLLSGIYFSGVGSADGSAVKSNFSIDDIALGEALTHGVLKPGAGLYVAQGVGEMPKRALGVAPLNDHSNNHVVGVRVAFGTLLFETIIVRPPEALFKSMVKQRRYRPGIIDFNGIGRDARICATWRNQGNEVNRLGFEIHPM